MTHPPEAVEAVAKFASDHALLIASGCNMSVIILDATALLDQIAPLYREQAARKVYGHAGAIRKQEAEAATWGGPDPRGDHYRTNAIAYAVALENIAATIRKGE